MREHHDTASVEYVWLWILLTQPWFALITLTLVVLVVLKLREGRRT